MTFSIEEKIAIKEVNEIISIMGNKYKSKIPKKLLSILQKEQAINEKTKIKKDIPFKKQQISRKALILLNYINTNYWMEKEKAQKVRNAYEENEKKYQEELRKKYNPNEIFKRRENKTNG